MKAITKALNAKVRVQNMKSANGTTVANQFIINSKYGRMFRSYDSNIVFIPNDENIIYLGKDWNYSTTTAKYRNLYLGINKKELEARIKNGTAKIIDLDSGNTPDKTQYIKRVEIIEDIIEENIDLDTLFDDLYDILQELKGKKCIS